MSDRQHVADDVREFQFYSVIGLDAGPRSDFAWRS
jgi:hypothetical protein